MKKIILLFCLFLSFLSHAQEVKYDLKYCPYERNLFDLWLPEKSMKKAPLVIYIHAGGFSSGDKTEIRNKQDMIDGVLKEGYAVASITYQ